MSILENNIEMIKNILNKELGKDVSPKLHKKTAQFEVNEVGLPCGETVSLNVFVSKWYLGIDTILESAYMDNVTAAEEFIAMFNMQNNIVKCGESEEGICVKTDAFIYPDNEHEEERLTRVLKTHLTELSGIIKSVGELMKKESKEEKVPQKPKKTKKPNFDFSLFD